MTAIPLITTDQALIEACRSLANAPFVTVDTEFVREYNYYPQLCLIQVASTDMVFCIDPMQSLDLTPLRVILMAPHIVKVMHAAHQDLEAFYHLWSELPAPLFDTQIAAAFIGIGDQIGYANLVHHYLHLDIDKSQTRTDWRKRPLTIKQLQYAADDVRHLARIYPDMRAQLQSSGRLSWLMDELEAQFSPARFQPEPEKQWMRIKGAQKLRGGSLAVLRALTEWREQTAIATDKPRRTVLSDDWLIELARAQPVQASGLEQLRNFPASIVSRHGPAIFECVKKAKALPKEQWPRFPHYQSLTAQQDAVLEALWAIVKLSAVRHNITPSLLATRGDLELLLQGNREIDLMQGWRQSICGGEILAFLQGSARLFCENGHLRLANP